VTPAEISVFTDGAYALALGYLRRRLPPYASDYAEDAVQSAFVDLWLARARLQSTEHARRYFWKAVRWQGIDVVQDIAKRAENELYADVVRTPIDDVVDDRHDRSADELLECLPKRSRDILRRCVIDCVPVKTIASDNRVSTERILQVMRTAKARLRAMLEAN